ncbi:MAG TPA: hypothetical protein VF258_06535, partial [Luteolibacter sp.]
MSGIFNHLRVLLEPALKYPRVMLAVAVAMAVVAGLFADSMNPYYSGVVIDIGIAIILAVSLNLINGHTGQFSLGHAGFMSVGAYVSAMLTLEMQKSMGPGMLSWAFLPALVAGGV